MSDESLSNKNDHGFRAGENAYAKLREEVKNGDAQPAKAQATEITASPDAPDDNNPNVRSGKMNDALWGLDASVAGVEALLDGGMSVEQSDSYGRSPLMVYTSKGSIEGVEMLLGRGADVNTVFMYEDRVPMTALDAAVQTGQKEIADILRSKGAKRGRELRPD